MIVRKKRVSKRTIDIHYKKTDSYRTYYADGVFGGITPKGNLFLEVFVERNPTPQIVKYSVTDNGQLGTLLNSKGKQGLIRQVECGIMIDMNVACSLRNWLNDKIKQFELLNQREKK